MDAPAAADRFEILAGDLIHRLKVRHREAPDALGADVLTAAQALEKLVDERGRGLDPFGEKQTSFLLERQGKRIQDERAARVEAEKRLAEACARASALAEEVDRLRAELMSEPTKATLEARERASREGAAWREECARCERPKLEHRANGACPVKGSPPMRSQWMCFACSAEHPYLKKIRGVWVWFCDTCARLGGSEDAGIRGMKPRDDSPESPT